jgi:23S rRNA (adenine2503-C2)-methyltransferase
MGAVLNPFERTCEEFAGELRRLYGKGLHHASALYREIFKRGNSAFWDAPEFKRSPSLAKELETAVSFPSCRITAVQEEGVVKFASALEDGLLVESVVIPGRGRTTLCVSSQVGCRMGCRFCVTGGVGFRRDLTTAEIVWQIHAARFELAHPIDHVVFMGMGEPLDNLENVIQAVRVMSDQRGPDIALKDITVSTAGHADGIRALRRANLPKLRLAVSLNGANDGLRSELMPINRLYPLARLKEELRLFPVGRGTVLFIEYVMMEGVNDSKEHALELAAFLEGLPVRVNVIAYNGGSAAPFSAPNPEKARRFCGWLADQKLFVRLRPTRGAGIMAACGQLGASLSMVPGA